MEVVLGLRVDHPEHRIGVRGPMHVCHAPIVAHDRDAVSLRTPARQVRIRRFCGAAEEEG